MSDKTISIIFTLACIIMVGGTGAIVLASNMGNPKFDWTVGIIALVVITLVPATIAAISTGLFKSSKR
jgi:hypothetical protein